MNGDRFEQFQVGDEPRVEISIPAGDVRLIPGDPGVITIRVDSSHADRLTITQRGDTVSVTAEKARRSFRGSFDVTTAVPPESDAEIKVAAADIAIDVDLGALRVSTASGDIRARDVRGDASIKTAAGDLRIGTVGGRLEVASASGDVNAVSCHDLQVHSASGDVDVHTATGRAQVRTAAGDVTLRNFDGPEFEGKSLSGDVWLGIPSGKAVDVDVQTMSGDVRSEFPVNAGSTPTGGTCTVRVKSLSGDVVFRPAS